MEWNLYCVNRVDYLIARNIVEAKLFYKDYFYDYDGEGTELEAETIELIPFDTKLIIQKIPYFDDFPEEPSIDWWFTLVEGSTFIRETTVAEHLLQKYDQDEPSVIYMTQSL